MRYHSLIVVLLVLFVGCVGAYGWWWKQNADQARAVVMTKIDALNALYPVLSYDAVTLSGFPATLSVDIVNPRIAVNPRQLMERFNLIPPQAEKTGEDAAIDDFAAVTNPFAPRAGWEEQATLDGRLRFQLLPFSKRYRVAVDGKWTSRQIVDGTVKSTYISHADRASSCTVKLTKLVAFKPIPHIAEAMPGTFQQWAPLFRNIRCESQGSRITTETGEPVMTVAHSEFRLSQEGSWPGRPRFALHIDVRDAEATPLADAHLAEIYALMGMIDGNTGIPLSAYGKQSTALDLIYEGPVTLASLLSVPAMRLEMPRLDTNSALYRMNGTGLIALERPANQTVATVSLQGEVRFDPRYDALLQESVKRQVEALYDEIEAVKTKEPGLAPTDTAEHTGEPAFESEIPREQMLASMEALLPRLSRYGSIKHDIRMQVQAAAPFDLATKGAWKIHAFNVTSDVYGMTMQGAFQVNPETGKPVGNITLSCLACDSFADDIGRLSRITAELVQFNTEGHTVSVNESEESAVADALRTLLYGLGVSKDNGRKDDLLFVFKGDSTGVITINGKTMEEAASLLKPLLDLYTGTGISPEPSDDVGPAGTDAPLDMPSPSVP